MKNTFDSTTRAELIARIQNLDEDSTAGFLHPFFGQLTADQAGKMAYKHIDHHLRQFNA